MAYGGITDFAYTTTPRRRKPRLRDRIRAVARDFAFSHERLFNTLGRIRRRVFEAVLWVFIIAGVLGAAWGLLILLDRFMILVGLR